MRHLFFNFPPCKTANVFTNLIRASFCRFDQLHVGPQQTVNNRGDIGALALRNPLVKLLNFAVQIDWHIEPGVGAVEFSSK